MGKSTPLIAEVRLEAHHLTESSAAAVQVDEVSFDRPVSWDGASLSSHGSAVKIRGPKPSEFAAEKRHHLRNMALMVAGLCCHFTAYLALQALQSSLNSKGGVGLLGLALMNVGSMLSTTFMSTFALKRFGERRLLQMSFIGFANLVAANALQLDTYMVLSFVLLGVISGIFWPGQYRYVTRTAKAYAACTNQDANDTVTRFHGAFFTFFVSTHFTGNLLSSLILSPKSIPILPNATNSTGINTTYSPLNMYATAASPVAAAAVNLSEFNSSSGAPVPWYYGECPPSPSNFKLLVDDDSRYLLMEIFGGLVFVGALCTFSLRSVQFLSKTDETKSIAPMLNDGDDEHDSDDLLPRSTAAQDTRWKRFKSSSLFSTLRLNADPRMYHLLPLMLMSAILKSFVYGEYTHFFIAQCLGTANVGYSMACFGAANAISCVFATKIAVRYGRPTVYALAMSTAVVTTIFVNCWHKTPSYPILFGVCAIWGMVDAVWNPTINAVIASFFPKAPEKAYANYALVAGTGFVSSFLLSSLLGDSYLPVFIKTGLIVIGLPISFYFYYKAEKKYGGKIAQVVRCDSDTTEENVALDSVLST